MRSSHKRSKYADVISLLCVQIFLVVAFLGIFDLFHNIIPRMRLQKEGMKKPIATVITTNKNTPQEVVTLQETDVAEAAESHELTMAVETAAPMPTAVANDLLESEASTEAAETMGTELITEMTDVPEPATPSQKAEASDVNTSLKAQTLREHFAEHFSEETSVEPDSYSSHNIAVKIEKYSNPPAFPYLTYFVADIYIADINCFQAAFPVSGTFAEGRYIARDNHAIVAINGDTMVAMNQGLLVRNGMLYQQLPGTSDYCVMYQDGRIETMSPNEYSVEEILERNPLHVWQFGPALLDKDGEPLQDFNISSSLLQRNPRTALGYYEPGHYCFVVVDGRRQSYSEGASMEELAELMKSLGCSAAFNLDGGASSVMVFNDELVNLPSAFREINDMLIIRELEASIHETP